jgi:hypothetical protein
MVLSPFSSRLGIDGLQVANPEGFSGEPLFRLDRGAVAVRLPSLFTDVIEIPEFTLDGLHVRLERSGSSTNIDRIMERIRGGGDDGTSAAGDAQTEQPTRLRVGYLRIAGVDAQVDLGPELGERGRFSLEVPAIELRDLGNDADGITVTELVESITLAVTQQVEASVAQHIEGKAREAAGQAIEGEKQKLEERLREEAGKLLGR